MNSNTIKINATQQHLISNCRVGGSLMFSTFIQVKLTIDMNVLRNRQLLIAATRWAPLK
jgi:hypothetical protein